MPRKCILNKKNLLNEFFILYGNMITFMELYEVIKNFWRSLIIMYIHIKLNNKLYTKLYKLRNVIKLIYNPDRKIIMFQETVL